MYVNFDRVIMATIPNQNALRSALLCIWRLRSPARTISIRVMNLGCAADFRYVPLLNGMDNDLIVADDENGSGPSTSVHAADSLSLHAG